MRKICILYDDIKCRSIFNIFLLYFLKPYNLLVEEKHISTDISNIFGYDAYIPTDVNSQYFIHKHKLTKHPIKNPQIFNYLDDKYLNKDINYYKNNFNVLQIPTLYDINFQNINKFIEKHKSTKYLFKHRNSNTTQNQIIIKSEKLLENYQKYTKDYILQTYINNYYIYSFDAYIINGDIISYFYTYVNKLNGIKFKDYLWQVKTIILNKHDKYFQDIKNFCESVAKQFNYTGIIEYEFIVHNKNIYFLEINPRLCGHLSQLHWNKSPYFNEIIIPYLNYEDIPIPSQQINTRYLSGTNILSSYMIFILLYYKYIIIFPILIVIITLLIVKDHM